MALQGIYRFKIAAAFEKDEVISYDELANRCSLDCSDLQRLLRMAISNLIFQEPSPGFVAHTAISQLIAADKLANSWVGLVCDEMWPPATRGVEALMTWPGSQELHETSFSLSNKGSSFWDVLKTDPARSQQFADGMQYLQGLPPFDIAHLIEALDWDPGCRYLMIDVGGSRGAVSIALLQQYPHLKSIVQDSSEVITTTLVPEDLTGRLKFMAHNMFVEQPIKNADVYFLRSILHDWPDKHAALIIQSLIPALRVGTRVVINEVCLPGIKSLPMYHAQFL